MMDKEKLLLLEKIMKLEKVLQGRTMDLCENNIIIIGQ